MKKTNLARVKKRTTQIQGGFNKTITRRRIVKAASQIEREPGIKRVWHDIGRLIGNILDGIKMFFRIGEPQPSPVSRYVKRPRNWHGTRRNGHPIKRNAGGFGKPQWMRDAGVKPFGRRK